MAHSVRPPNRLNEARTILARLTGRGAEIRDGIHFTQCVLCGAKARSWSDAVIHTESCIVTEAQRWLIEVP